MFSYKTFSPVSSPSVFMQIILHTRSLIIICFKLCFVSPECKYVLWFPLSFIEAEKTNLKKSKIVIFFLSFFFFFFSSEANSRTIRHAWTEMVPKCFSLSCKVLWAYIRMYVHRSYHGDPHLWAYSCLLSRIRCAYVVATENRTREYIRNLHSFPGNLSVFWRTND